MAIREESVRPEEQVALGKRFMIAQDAPVVDIATRTVQLRYQDQIRGLIYDAATAVQQTTEPSREQSLALTHLEEALMWAGKALFS